MKITIAKMGGEIEISSPSLATCFEFVSLWTSESDNAQLARLCAGSIGVCIDHLAKLPKYRPSRHRASDYGHTSGVQPFQSPIHAPPAASTPSSPCRTSSADQPRPWSAVPARP